MAKNKTTENELSVDTYINNIADESRRKNCAALTALMQTVTGFPPKMWGAAIVGFGSYHYKYDSGHEGDAPLAGYASRANAIALYLSLSAEQRETLLAKFGKYKTGKGCIYIQKLEDIDTKVLSQMVTNSVANNKNKYPS